MTNHYTFLDSLKGIAICGVVMTHINHSEIFSYVSRIANAGTYGVQLFFIISAYLAFISYTNNISSQNPLSCIRWILYKFIKIIPVYYLALIISTIITGGNNYWLGSENHITVWNMLSHITFTNGLFPHFIDSIIGVEWYLADLAILYFLTPFLYKKINTLEKSIIYFIAAIFISLALDLISRQIFSGDNIADSYLIKNFFSNFFFLCQTPSILLGFIIYHIQKNKFLSYIKYNKIFSYSLVAISGLFILGLISNNNKIFGIGYCVLYACAFFLIIISQFLNPHFLIDNPVFRTLGKYSYPIYLFHFLLIEIYDRLNISFATNNTMNYLIEFSIVTIISLIIAIPLIKFYEKPISNKIKQLINKSNQKTSA